MGKIQWKFIFSSLAASAVIFLTVFAVPFYRNAYAPVVLTAACVLVLILASTRTSWVEIAILSLGLVLAATTLLSIEIHRSWLISVGVGGGLVLLLLSRAVTRRWLSPSQVAVGLLTTAGIYQVILTVELFTWLQEWQSAFPGQSTPLSAFRFDNGNGWAGYLIPVMMLQLGLFFALRRSWARWLLTVLMGWSLVLFYFASSRGGMIGLAAAGLCFILVERKLIFAWLQPAWKMVSRRRWLLAAAGCLVVAGIAAAGWVLFRAIESHPTHAAFGFGSRAGFWIPAWQAFLGSPLWGNGLFTEAGFYLRTISLPPDGLYYHSHNMYLDILQGMGVLGAAAAAGLITLLWRGLRRARRSESQDAVTQVLTMSALPALVGFLTHSLFDSLFWLPMVTIPLCVLLGAALAFDDSRLKIRFPAAQIAAVLVLAGAWGLYFVQQPYLNAVAEADTAGWQQTAVRLDQSVDRLPVSPLFNREAGYAHAELSAQAGGVALDTAIARFAAAAASDPNFALNWLNLGALRREAGDLAGARAAMETAAERAWKWGLAWLNLGQVCELQADDVCARQAYLKALDLEPDWSSDPFWQETGLRQAAATAARAASRRSEPQAMEIDAVIRQGYAGPVLVTAGDKIANGSLDDTERLLKLAPMLFVRNERELVELHWLEAELAAARGNTALAVELGQAARQEFVDNRLNDAIAAGLYVYGPGIYQLPTLGIDLVPQVTWMQYPGDWQERLQKLEGWQE